MAPLRAIMIIFLEERKGGLLYFVKRICVYLYLYLPRNPGSRVVLCGAWKLVPGAD